MKKQNGFTLVELMATTVILALVVSVVVPSLTSMFEKKNIPEIAKLFERSIKLARTEAINKNSTVDIIPNSGNTDWSQGWYIQYTNSEGKAELIRNFEAVPGNPTFTSDLVDRAIRLQILSTGQAFVTGKFKLFSPDNCTVADSYNFELLSSGMLKKEEGECP